MPPFMMISGGSRGICHGHSFEQVGGGPQPIILPNRQGWYGDSQTAGRADATPSALSHQVAFNNIRAENNISAAPIQNNVRGVGGRSMQGHYDDYANDSFASTPWIHVQDSGLWDRPGSDTEDAHGDTFQTFMELIWSRTPGALITTETAYNYRRDAEFGYNWDTRNQEIKNRIAGPLAAQGITVRVVDVDFYMKIAVTQMGYEVPCYPDVSEHPYHYLGIGNFLIALVIYKALNYDVTQLAHTSVILDGTHKSTCVSIVAGNNP